MLTKQTFESFVVGESNRFAHAAASAIAQDTTDAWNPLCLVGPSGVGKTHLLHAIAAERDTNGDSSHFYIRAEALSADVHQIRRKASFVMVDDLQDFGSDLEAHKLLAADVEDLINAGTHLVFAGDRLPRDLFGGSIASRLTSRLEGGLVVTIAPPEPSTRLKIVQQFGRIEGIEIDDECADAIGRFAGGSVRTLEGRVSKVIFALKQCNEPLTTELVENLLHTEPQYPPLVTIEAVKQRVASDYQVSVREIDAHGREGALVEPRHVAMSLARELTDASLLKLARAFGRRDHTTVLHACRRIKKLCDVRPELKARVHRIRAEILG